MNLSSKLVGRFALFSLLAALAGTFLLLSLVAPVASAQFGIPHVPGLGKKKSPPPDSSSTPPAPPAMPDMPGMPGAANAAPPASAQPAVSAPGVPVAADNPVFNSYMLLEKQGSYHTAMTLVPSGDQLQKAAASGFQIKGIDQYVKGDVRKASMRYSMKTADPVSGLHVDDWEASAVVQGGSAAHLLYSPTATPRILAEADAKAAQQLAMMDAMFAQSAVRNAASGPIGWAVTGVDAASSVASQLELSRMMKTAHQMMSWQCQSLDPSVAQSARTLPTLTDLKSLGDDTVNGVAVAKYEFYVHDNKGKVNGPIRMSVAKDSGLPARLELNDPAGQGSMSMDYDITTPVNIEMPDCMPKK